MLDGRPASGVGIVHRTAISLWVEAAHEFGVGFEFWRAAVKLSSVAQQHPRTPMHVLYHAAQAHVGVAISEQLAHFIAILTKAHDGKVAGLVRHLWRTHTSKKRVPSGSSTTS
jgi:hypothetical protein